MLILPPESLETMRISQSKIKTCSVLTVNQSLFKFDTCTNRVKHERYGDCNHPIEKDMNIAKNNKN